ncbi:hypothetical protein NXS19_010983 [Fusarium pseudograminearum]|nr:hypothetical protein NXS19_010983 [Fusarium pseudograminearum]
MSDDDDWDFMNAMLSSTSDIRPRIAELLELEEDVTLKDEDDENPSRRWLAAKDILQRVDATLVQITESPVNVDVLTSDYLYMRAWRRPDPDEGNTGDLESLPESSRYHRTPTARSPFANFRLYQSILLFKKQPKPEHDATVGNRVLLPQRQKTYAFKTAGMGSGVSKPTRDGILSS